MTVNGTTGRPMRAMIRMFTTTYGESVSCTPICDIGEPTGPMLNGSTYIVRPCMHPLNNAFSFFGGAITTTLSSCTFVQNAARGGAGGEGGTGGNGGEGLGGGLANFAFSFSGGPITTTFSGCTFVNNAAQGGTTKWTRATRRDPPCGGRGRMSDSEGPAS